MTNKKIWFFSAVDKKYTQEDFQLSDCTIIPTDIKSANILDILKIKYAKPENFLDRKDYFEIDKTAIQIARNWWKEKNSGLSYCNIQLEYLLEWEMMITLTKLLKNLAETQKIIEIEKPDIIWGTVGKNMFKNVPSFIAKKLGIPFQEISKDNSKKSFHLDVVPITIKVGSKFFSLNSSDFKKIKKLTERITKIIKIPRRKSSERLLLLDFNIVLYETLFDALEKQGFEVFLLNKRRPVVWNKESFKIELQKKYNFGSLADYNTKDSKNRIKEKISTLTSHLNELWEKNLFSDQFFYSKLNFWNLLEDDLLAFCKSRMAESISDIELGETMMKKEDFSMLLVWGYPLQFEKTMLLLAKKMGTPSLTLQDGVKGIGEDRKYGKRYSPENFEIESDFIASWGKLSKKYYIYYGIKPERIIDIGNPRYDKLFNINSSFTNNSNIILLATSGIGSSFSYPNTLTMIKKYEELIKQVCLSVKKLHDKKLIIKLHPFADDIINIPSLVHKIDKNIQIVKHENVAKLIQKSDLVISTYSTVIMESIILGKATIVFNIDDQILEPEHLPYVRSGAALGLNHPSELTNLLSRFYSDSELRSNLKRNSSNLLINYFSNQGISSEALSKYIRSLIKFH